MLIISFLSLFLHSSVLEPDLDLALGETEKGGHFYPPGPTQVAVEVELLLQLHELGAGVRRPRSLGGL